MREKVEQFRATQKPITTFWVVDGQPYHGALSWHVSQPTLELTCEIAAESPRYLEESNHPLLCATKPPRQANIIAKVSGLGEVTCALLSTSSLRAFTRAAGG